MNNTFKYRSDDYDRQSQRFVIPLYIKDSLGNYNFSATGTFVKYNNQAYVLCAAHMLEDSKIVNVCFLNNDRNFDSILDNSVGYDINKEFDLVIVNYFNIFFGNKNYFNLNLDSLIGFDKNHFAWTGFPSSKVKQKTVHNTKK